MENVLQRAVMAVEYFNAVTGNGEESEFWAFSQNCFGETACLLWCHVFKSYSDDLHYKNLFGNNKLVFLDESFSYGNVQKRLLDRAGMTIGEYTDFRESVVSIRDQFIAHRDTGTTGLIFPKINIARDMCLELMNIFKEGFSKAKEVFPNNSQIFAREEYFRWHDEHWLLRKCNNELIRAGIVQEN